MAVVKKEIADQRRHVRSTAPIAVRILGASYTVEDWSLGGFRVADFLGGSQAAGNRLLAQFTLAYHDFDISFVTEVEVVRQSADERTVAARFTRLNAREAELLGHALLGPSCNGQRAAVLEALARVDVSVTPVSAVPTPREAPARGNAGLLLSRAFWSLFYWAAGLALGAAILLLVYFTFFRLDLEYAVVTLPLYPVISQDVARCKEVYVKEGDRVRAGQKLVLVEDDYLTRDLEVARLQFDAAGVDLDTARARVGKEKNKLALYKKISTEKLQSAQALAAAVAEQRDLTASIAKRIRNLHLSRSASQQDLELAEQRAALLVGQALQAKAELQIAENSVYAIEHGHFYDQRRLVGDLPQFLVNLDDAEKRYQVAKARVRQTEERAARLTYKAPFDGKVARVNHVVGGTMNRGEAILILEKAGEELAIDGFVTQDDAKQLTLGANASLWVPALDRTLQGQIVKIDRTSGFLTEMQAHLNDSQLRYNWRGRQDRSAHVQLAITEQLDPEVRGQLTGGMPVIASLPQRPALWAKVCALFQH